MGGLGIRSMHHCEHDYTAGNLLIDRANCGLISNFTRLTLVAADFTGLPL